MYDLTRFQRDLLFVIAGLDEPHGVKIGRIIQDYYPSEIQDARLYTNLDTLVAKGLVEKGKIDNRTNSYVLTPRGERELRARREWEDNIVNEFELYPSNAP